MDRQIDNLTFSTSNSELNSNDQQIMVEGMLAYHASKGHPRTVDHCSIIIRNQNNKMVGVVTVSFLWNGMEINSLWVNENYRRQGLGRKLMGMAEQEGIKRGASFAYTNTFSWQSPGFYQKLGYVVFGVLDNFPQGCTLSYFRKTLIPSRDAVK